MGSIIVGSQRKGSPLNSPLVVGVTVSIGRDSVLGNPFDMGRDESLRMPVCEAHEAWLEVVLEKGAAIDPVKLAVAMAADLGLKVAQTWKRPTAREVVESLHRIAQLAKDKEVWIICWCAPAMCHGDAYKAAIEDGRVEAAYARLHSPKASPEPAPVPPSIPDWCSAITPAAIAQTTFEYRGGWIKNWFSNMNPFDEPLVWDGVAYRTPENLYQAMKTSDLAERARIAAMSPVQAKQAGKRVNLRPDWEQVRERYMEVALRHKFKPGTSWHQRLMDTANEPIIEFNNWHDNFWGVCICQRCQPKPKRNRLGVLLMQIRAEYQGDQGDSGNSDAPVRILPPQPSGNPLAEVEPPIDLALSSAPQHIEVLEPNQVFVFGTNTEGRHGKGAAGDAFGRRRFRYDGAVGKWAIYGQARGLMRGKEGLSYGIVTKDLNLGERSIPLSEIESQIDELVKFAQSRPDLEFLIAPFGTALAGYSCREIAALWQGKPIPTNIKLPQIWLDLLT